MLNMSKNIELQQINNKQSNQNLLQQRLFHSMSLKDYDIVILVTKMVRSEDFLFQHRKDETTQFQTWSFKGSTQKCPKFYHFIKQETSQTCVKLQKLKQLNQSSQEEEQKLATFKIQKQSNQLFITLIRTYSQHQIPFYHMVRLYQDGFKIKEGDKIKLGLNYLDVKYIRKQKNNIKKKLINNSEKSTQNLKIYHPNNQSDSEERACKICLNYQAAEGTPVQKRYLINPCNCREPVHMICLQQWIKTKFQSIPQKYDFLTFEQTLSSFKLQCQICKAFYYDLQRVIYGPESLNYNQIDLELNLEQKQQDRQILKIKQLSQRPLRIGRSQIINQIVLYDETASRNHAWLQRSNQNRNDILLKDKYPQVPKYGTLVEVNKKNQRFLLPLGQRRGIQMQTFVIIFQLKQKQNKK